MVMREKKLAFKLFNSVVVDVVIKIYSRYFVDYLRQIIGVNL